MNRFAGTTAGESRRRAVRAAREAFGPAWKTAGVAIAPGRIEILGNHVDYNGGPVLAAAVDRATVILSDDAEGLSVLFADFPNAAVELINLSTSAVTPSSPGSPLPSDFVLGAIARSRRKGHRLRGGRFVV